jgi:hypothetical protein
LIYRVGSSPTHSNQILFDDSVIDKEKDTIETNEDAIKSRHYSLVVNGPKSRQLIHGSEFATRPEGMNQVKYELFGRRSSDDKGQSSVETTATMAILLLVAGLFCGGGASYCTVLN